MSKFTSSLKTHMNLKKIPETEGKNIYVKVIQYRISSKRVTRKNLWHAWKELCGIEIDTHAIDRAINDAIIYNRMMRAARGENHE